MIDSNQFTSEFQSRVPVKIQSMKCSSCYNKNFCFLFYFIFPRWANAKNNMMQFYVFCFKHFQNKQNSYNKYRPYYIYIYARLSIPFGFRVFYLFLKTIFKDKICLVTYLYAETGNKLKINIFIFGFMRILYGFNVVCFLVLVWNMANCFERDEWKWVLGLVLTKKV